MRTRGHLVLIDPLLRVEPLALPPVDLAGFQAIIVTSRHAVPALAELATDLPVFCVGAATASQVMALGKTDVLAGPGDASGLARMLVERLRPEDGRLLHLAGQEVRAELRAYLEGHRFQIVQAAVYRARPAAALAPTTRAALARRGIDAVLLFSPRSAAVFMALSGEHDLGRVDALCLSANAAAALDPGRFARVLVAARPDEAALLDLLEAPGLG